MPFFKSSIKYYHNFTYFIELPLYLGIHAIWYVLIKFYIIATYKIVNINLNLYFTHRIHFYIEFAKQ